MCGVAGIVYANGRQVEHNILENMTRELKHRGPDDEGIHIMCLHYSDDKYNY